jgi:hypothetical protein
MRDALGRCSHGCLCGVRANIEVYHGSAWRQRCELAPAILADEREVVALLAEWMRGVLCGERTGDDGSH